MQAGSGSSAGAWLKQRGSVFGPGAEAGYNLWHGSIKQHHTNKTIADAISEYDDSKKRCDEFRRALRRLESQLASASIECELTAKLIAASEAMRSSKDPRTMCVCVRVC